MHTDPLFRRDSYHRSQDGFNKRSWTGVVLSFVLALAIACTPTAPLPTTDDPPSPETARLVISVWGGSYAEEFRKHVADPFAAEHDVDIVIDGGLSGERLAKLLVTRDNPEVDLFYITDYQGAIANNADLLQPIRPENFENLDELYDFARDPLGDNTCPAFTVLGVGLAYNNDHWGTPPASWLDFWRADLPGDVGVPDMAVSYGPLFMLKVAELNGGGVDNVDPGFERIAELKDRMQVFFSTEILQSINQGDVSLSPQLNIFVREDPELPLRFAWPQEGALGVVNLACVVTGTEHRDLAEKFIDFHLSRQVQLDMAVNQGESPTNRLVAVPDDLPFNLIVGEDAINRLNFWDSSVIVASRDAWLQRWQEEIIAE